MQLQEQYQRDSNSITHSPYYGCTVRVVSKACVSYEGVLDGISVNKDRIFLKNVRVKGNIINTSHEAESIEKLNTLNTVMIDHLTNDMHIYDHVCLNVRDIQELKLIRLPATFHESQAKLRAIDPCLLDIRLSPSDQQQRISNESLNEYHQPTPIVRHVRGESLGSNGGGGGSALISSSSNESSSSFGYHPHEGQDDFFDDQIQRFSQLSTNVTSKPATLLAKKVLPKKFERNHFRSLVPENRTTNNPHILKIVPLNNQRKVSPIRVTITSKLNPNATPFYGQQQRPVHGSFKFYERNRFPPRPPAIMPLNRSQATSNPTIHTPRNHQHHSHQRFVPPRQMVTKKNFNNQTLPSPSSYFNKRPNLQQQTKHKTSSYEQIIPGLMRQTLSPVDQISSTPSRRERLSVPSYNRSHRSPISLHSTSSLPYQSRGSKDRNPVQISLSYTEPIGSHRGQRTVSGTSTGSSMSTDIGPHSIVQHDSTLNILTSPDGQYDFEKANEEFRRYLELEELVTRRTSLAGSIVSHTNENSSPQSSQAHSYKKDISFFDRISCTATTGTAVAYTEIDEVEKNLETFGEDALLISSSSADTEWQI